MAAAELFVFGAVSVGLKHLVHYMSGHERPPSAKLVGKVKAVTLYPFKSLSGISLQQCPATFAGLEINGVRDRQWMLVTARNRTFVTARAQPRIVTIATSDHGNALHLDAAGMPTLVLKKNLQVKDADVLQSKVWGQDISGVDAGDEAAEWMETFLGKAAGTYRVLYHSDRLPKRVLVKQDDPWMEQCKPQDEVQYQDGFPYLLLSAASVSALEASVRACSGDTMTLTPKRFRPNIVVDGCDAYAEDKWKDVYIGDAKFTNIKPCGRCTFTTVDEETGTKHTGNQPLKTLKQVRPKDNEGSPSFGVNLVVDWPGEIAVGQPVYATL